MNALLVLDQGTTSTRALVVDPELRTLGSAQLPLQQYFPAPGLVEHDPLEIWQASLQVAQTAIARAGLRPAEIRGVGLTNQRETTLIWSRRTGLPLHRAIVWQDRRTAAACTALRASGVGAWVAERSGLVLDPYFSASKLRWLLDHVPDARRLATTGELAFGTIDSWLLWQLSGGRAHLTDASNASRTQLYDIQQGRWDPELLALWDIPPEVLPKVVDSSGELCEISGALGIGPAVYGVAGDQQAALFGQRCFAPGEAKCTYGTGCFMLANAGSARPHAPDGLLATVAWQLGGRLSYALEGSVFMGGATVQWLRDGLQLIDSAEAVEALAASVPDSGGVVLVPAFTGLGAPHWDPDARGLLIGLSRGTQRGHIARAALEAIALQVSEVLDAMNTGLGTPLRTLKVDGGASRNDLLMQVQSDLAGLPLTRAAQPETTALGAALLAGLGAAVWPSMAAIEALPLADRTFSPDGDPQTRAGLQARWRAAIARSRGWASLGQNTDMDFSPPAGSG